jgi:hypothetical protein
MKGKDNPGKERTPSHLWFYRNTLFSSFKSAMESNQLCEYVWQAHLYFITCAGL